MLCGTALAQALVRLSVLLSNRRPAVTGSSTSSRVSGQRRTYPPPNGGKIRSPVNGHSQNSPSIRIFCTKSLGAPKILHPNVQIDARTLNLRRNLDISYCQDWPYQKSKLTSPRRETTTPGRRFAGDSRSLVNNSTDIPGSHASSVQCFNSTFGIASSAACKASPQFFDTLCNAGSSASSRPSQKISIVSLSKQR